VARQLRDHPANEDEADRHTRPRRVPPVLAIAVAVLIVAALAYLRARGIDR
jgi:hypothetical protein